MEGGVTIVGGGLAGCSLAWALRWRGCRVILVDRGEPDTSTKVAAGIINPITGPNLTLSWRFGDLWGAALDFYQRISETCGSPLFHQIPLLRLFDSDRQVARWAKRCNDKRYPRLCDPAPEVPPCYASEFGGFQTPAAGYLDTGAFLSATRSALAGDWQEGEFPHGAAPGGAVIFCEGMGATANPLFDWVTFKPAKGEVLTVESDDLPSDRIVNRGGVWLLPIGGNRFRAGATYRWGATDSDPTAEGRDEIETRLRRLVSVPLTVVGHRAAVRPVIRASRLLIGMHPARPEVGFFNGLGSKGVLTAPYFAQQFAAALLGQGEIDPEVDLRKNL